jgi:hypothetical protein
MTKNCGLYEFPPLPAHSRSVPGIRLHARQLRRMSRAGEPSTPFAGPTVHQTVSLAGASCFPHRAGRFLSGPPHDHPSPRQPHAFRHAQRCQGDTRTASGPRSTASGMIDADLSHERQQAFAIAMIREFGDRAAGVARSEQEKAPRDIARLWAMIARTIDRKTADRRFHHLRFEQELAMAAASRNPAVRQSHLQLAELHAAELRRIGTVDGRR